MEEKQSTLAPRDFCPSLTVIGGYKKLLMDLQKKKCSKGLTSEDVYQWVNHLKPSYEKRKQNTVEKKCVEEKANHFFFHTGNFCL